VSTKPTLTLTLALSVTALCFSAPARAYEGAPVQGGGAVVGTVVFKGKAPAPKTLPVTKNPEACGTSKKSEELVVGKGGALQYAVVYLADIQKGKPATAATVTLDQKACVYVPHVQAAVKGSKVVIRNSDPVMHNVHATLKAAGRLLFNVGMPGQQNVNKSLRRPGIAEVTCDAGHTWMKAFIYVFEHPYFAVTGADGAFRLTDVPPGTYKLTVWHETLGEKTQTVTVAAGAEAKAQFELGK